MHITMGIGAMLLGGWVLTSPVDQDNLRPVQPAPQPAVAAPRPGAGQSANQYDTRAMDKQGYRRMLEEERGMRHERRVDQSPSRMQRQASGTGMPTSPTNPAQGAAGLPLSPTSDPTLTEGPGQGQDAMDQPFGSGGPQMPVAPTSQGRPSPSYSSGRGSSGAMQRPSSRSTPQPSFGGSAGPTQKAFSTYNPFSSGVSPYMNLFRRDTDMGTVDNYTTLVRPALEQRAANQRFNMDIFGLERRARIQQHSIQRMEQTDRTLQGIGTPQYYMNYGGYYGNSGSGQ
ncbi:MAG: hypothetical protein KKA28_06000 [Planctomycetes bacterium]|nr:hypothetical protein [Planctomycetota bacterium]